MDDDDLTGSLTGLSAMLTDHRPLRDTLTEIAQFAVNAIPGADGAGLTMLEDGQHQAVVSSSAFVRAVDDIQYGLGEGPCIQAVASQTSGCAAGAAGSRHLPGVPHAGTQRPARPGTAAGVVDPARCARLPRRTGARRDRVGRATRQRRPWAQLLTGPSPAPRAWDHLFARQDLTGWVRLRLLDLGSTSATTSDGAETVSGRWLVGAFSGAGTGLGAYAAGYPDAQDLYLADTALCDPYSGEFLLGSDGTPQLRGVGRVAGL